MLSTVAPGDVLDAGMGPGRLCVELDALGWTVSGVDASERMVEAARARLPHARDRLVHADLERIPFAAGAFDAVAATGVLEYVDDLHRALGELHRVLRPGGVAVISITNAASLAAAWLSRAYYPTVRAVKSMLPAARPAPRGLRPPTLAGFEAALERAGWQVTARRYVNPVVLLAPFDRLAPRAGLRASEALEGRHGRLARSLTTQVVYLLRPTA